MNQVFASLVVLVALCGNCGAALAGVSYTVTDLGTLGGRASAAYAINNAGQIAGASTVPSDDIEYAVLWTEGRMVDLGRLSGVTGHPSYRPLAINNIGDIVGYSNDFASGDRHAFLYSGGGPMLDLGSLGGADSVAVDINDSGQIVGESGNHAFTCSGTAPMQDLGTLGGFLSRARGINNAGQIVGSARVYNGNSHAFLYSGTGPMQDLGIPALGGYSWAAGINDLGQIIGGFSDSQGLNRVFLYSGSGVVQDLGTFGVETSALSINNRAEIVGYGFTGGRGYFAFYWGGSGPLQDLNTLIDPGSGWTLNQARCINDHGKIVGYGTNPEGYTHAFLLTPIPEPSTLSLLVIGVAGVLAFVWRARSRKQ